MASLWTVSVHPPPRGSAWSDGCAFAGLPFRGFSLLLPGVAEVDYAVLCPNQLRPVELLRYSPRPLRMECRERHMGGLRERHLAVCSLRDRRAEVLAFRLGCARSVA